MVLIFKGEISYGSFLAITQLVSAIKSPVISISGYIPKYYSLLSSLERLIEVEEYKEDLKDQYEQKEINEYYDNKFKKLGLRKINFKYDQEYVLKNFSFELKKGEIVGLVGESGIGKSTVLKLLMCLYETDGKRYIDNKVLDSKYRRLFAYVPQTNNLFAGSIKSIISFNQEVNEARLKQACKAAIVDFIDDFDTNIKEGNYGLSQGQMQRIAIARAIYSDRPIILLDEATSALDSNTEKRLLKNIKKLTNKTIVFVTHRNSSLKICDKVVRI